MDRYSYATRRIRFLFGTHDKSNDAKIEARAIHFFLCCVSKRKKKKTKIKKKEIGTVGTPETTTKI